MKISAFLSLLQLSALANANVKPPAHVATTTPPDTNIAPPQWTEWSGRNPMAAPDAPIWGTPAGQAFIEGLANEHEQSHAPDLEDAAEMQSEPATPHAARRHRAADDGRARSDAAASFARWVDELRTAALRHADAALRPFIEDEIAKIRDTGARAARVDGDARVVLVPTDILLSRARHAQRAEEDSRLSAIDGFYSTVAGSGRIHGAQHARDWPNMRMAKFGEITFESLQDALDFAPRGRYVQSVNVGAVPVQSLSHRPPGFEGAEVRTIKYRDPAFVRRWYNSPEDAYVRLDLLEDEYSVNGGESWTPLARTSPAQERAKAEAAGRMLDRARAAVQ